MAISGQGSRHQQVLRGRGQLAYRGRNYEMPI
jgi:hypothetical protein